MKHAWAIRARKTVRRWVILPERFPTRRAVTLGMDKRATEYNEMTPVQVRARRL
jgi:hypothetical protein